MSTARQPDPAIWGFPQNTVATIARNVATRYVVITIDTLIGLVVMPFNVRHLGQAAWGLWLLTGSLSSYFTVLDLGYGSSTTRFVAFYRAREDARSINEITSTLFVIFTVIGMAVYGAYTVVAFNVASLFNLSAGQADVARTLLLISGTQVAMGIPFGVFGGVMNGFQRYDINNLVSLGTSFIVAVTNVAMLLAGYGLVELVAATTLVRLVSNLVYAANTYRVFPALSVRPSMFRPARLREVTGYSVYAAVINWANRLNYMADTVIIGIYMTPVAVALWAVPRRLAQAVRSFTNQFNAVLLPVVVDTDTRQSADKLRTIFVFGTKLSLAAVVPLSACMFLLSDPLIPRYVGATFRESIPVAQVLAWVIAFRVGNATANIVLKGANRHRMLAFTNMGIALANVGLSVVWIQRFGLIGQAFGPLVPVAAGSIFILWPAACRRVGMNLPRAFRLVIWPTLWPLIGLISLVLTLKALLPATIPTVLVAASIGILSYAVIFLTFAIDRDERATYRVKLREIIWWGQKGSAKYTKTLHLRSSWMPGAGPAGPYEG